MATAKTNDVVRIEIPPINIQRTSIRIVGDTPLIVHNWSEKSKKEMLDKQMKKASTGRTTKDPEQDFRDSLYVLPDGRYGFPSVGFKNAAVTACTSLDKSVTKVGARQAFHVSGELVVIEGDQPTPREDMVRVGMGSADLRYRGEFKNWYADIEVVFNPHAMSLEQIINLFNYAGFGVGVGEWRPEKNGQFGRFHVALEGE